MKNFFFFFFHLKHNKHALTGTEMHLPAVMMIIPPIYMHIHGVLLLTSLAMSREALAATIGMASARRS